MQNKKYTIFYLLFILTMVSFNYSVFSQVDTKSWTDYRGPEKNGHSAAQNIPTSWNDSTNVAWKTPIPGRGWSSPVVLNNKIWLTTGLANGKELRLLAIHSTTGEIMHDLKLFEVDSLQESHPLNSYASPLQ